MPAPVDTIDPGRAQNVPGSGVASPFASPGAVPEAPEPDIDAPDAPADVPEAPVVDPLVPLTPEVWSGPGSVSLAEQATPDSAARAAKSQGVAER
ncbi:MAG TPA: hypothetical protein VK841_21210 [Polyangiaceae bacterium]|nr:hypothetical protein [Polyangiaceae bacterium]